jgi:hypothetical protein
MDYPKLTELRNLGGLYKYWNWNNWPMTTSHVVDAAARAAKELDPSLISGAAELLRRYTKVHFIEGDLNRPCVSEYFDPISGQPNSPKLDYAHSYYIDLIMRHVVGIEADPLSKQHRPQRRRIDPDRMGQHSRHMRGLHRGDSAKMDERAGCYRGLDHRRIFDAALFYLAAKTP